MTKALTAALVGLVFAGCGKDEAGEPFGTVSMERLIPEPAVLAAPRRPVDLAEPAACSDGCSCCGEAHHALSSICNAMLKGDAAARCQALVELGNLREGVQDGDDEAERQSIVVMTAGLSDPDESVRDAAFETLLRLPDGDRRALSLQVLGNDDKDIKLALLKLGREPRDEFEFTFNFQALDAEEPEVREKASENLKELVGKTFDSTEAAFDWWEKAPEAHEIAAIWQTGGSHCDDSHVH